MPLFKPEALYTEPEELEDFLLLAASSVMRGRLPIVRLSDPHFRTWESRPILLMCRLHPSVCSLHICVLLLSG